MRIQKVRVSGFRGFRDLVEMEFASGFTVIDGRNGVGKSTIFDAVEFALTGRLTKYGEAKSGGETVEDYIWWRGDGQAPAERFVEVTFCDAADPLVIRRSPIEGPDARALGRVEAGMANLDIAPPSPLSQLCAASIIRDESIASLSLDLSETERYAMLRQAIGASDSDAWTKRALSLLNAAKKRSEQSKADVAAAGSAVAQASRRLDEARASIAPDQAIADAARSINRLLSYGNAPPDQLVAPARGYIAQRELSVRNLTALVDQWEQFQSVTTRLAELDRELEAAKIRIADAQADRATLPPPDEALDVASSTILVQQLHELRHLGSQIGLIDEGCPLCAAEHSEASFALGLLKVLDRIDRIDREASEAAAEQTRRREALKTADKNIADAQQQMARIAVQATESRRSAAAWQNVLAADGLPLDAAKDVVEETLEKRRVELDQAQRALSVLSTLQQNDLLEASASALQEAQARLARAQERAGLTRRTETAAGSLYDAARRAAAETLDLRLERMLPLMSELYSRLRPHPVWQDIEYLIRGDLRRFLSLQVGEGLNPQFLFSSGQRRATGLAFLLAIHLSLAWSRWRSILLDDPVQHVDDFRTVNLAEVLAQLVAAGRQVVVAVEDPALADLLTRRMPVAEPGSGSRLTLGLGDNGSSAVVERRDVAPMIPKVLAA